MRYARNTHPAGRRLALVALAFGLAACGNDDDMMGPINADIVGSWSYVISDATTANVTCGITGITLTFTQGGGGLEGAMAAAGGGNIVCVDQDGTTASASLTGGTSIRDITVNGANVSFEFWDITNPFVATGSITGNGNTMSGTVTFTLNFGATVVPFTGTWVATRQ